jgi:uncharacterized membrane protein
MYASEMIWIGLLIIFLSLLLCINKETRWRGIEWTARGGGYIPLFPYWLMLFFVGFFMVFLGIIALRSH